jgi:hypothetical protein
MTMRKLSNVTLALIHAVLVVAVLVLFFLSVSK